MTVAVSSHQRREPLRRLLEAIRQQLVGDAELRSGLDLVVVLDGSTDGSSEMLNTLRLPVPLAIREQEQRGLAAARNTGLRVARGEIVWFLDDDLLPADGLIRRHRHSHASKGEEITVGSTPIPPALSVAAEIRHIDDHHYSQWVEPVIIERFDQVTMANTSGPSALLRDVGGFDESLKGYGYEDYELGARLLERGIRIRFDPDAVAWHHPTDIDFGVMRRRSRLAGRNAVRVVQAHPWTANEVLGVRASWRAMRLLGKFPFRSAGAMELVSQLAAMTARLGRLVAGEERTRSLRRLAVAAAFVAGVADENGQGELLSLLLGGPSREWNAVGPTSARGSP